jgi:hypothetical protein
VKKNYFCAINAEQAVMLDFIKDFWLFLKERRRWWLAPIIIIILLFSLLIIFAGSSALSPFIYSLF